MKDDVIALVEFESAEGEVTVRDERHYRLVALEDPSETELARYRDLVR